jgi:hypothetical protein
MEKRLKRNCIKITDEEDKEMKDDQNHQGRK